MRIGAAAAGGFAVFGGFAPSTLWWLPIVGFALLGLAVHGRRAKPAAGLGLVFGCCFFIPLLSWTGVYVGATPWLALAIAEAVLVMPATALMGPASRLLPAWPLWAAAAWVAGETLRALFPFGGFPWGGIAFSQPDGPLLPLAALVGESGLSFAVAACGFSAAEVLRRWGAAALARRRPAAGGPTQSGLTASRPEAGRPDGGATRPARPDGEVTHADRPAIDRLDARPGRHSAAARWASAAAVVAALAPFAVAGLAGGVVQTGAGAPTTPIGMVQGNVPEPGLEFNARRRAVLDMHAAETARLADAIHAGTAPQPTFVVWPENSSDIDPYTNSDAADVIDSAVREVGVPILVGAVTSAGRPGYVYNKGIVWNPGTGPGQTYTKRHPIPFGEYMPWRGFFRLFSDKVDLVQADFLPGTKPGNLTIAGVPVGDVICFEVVEDGLVGDVVAGGAKVIVVQTNNATFGYTAETYQQQAMSRVRAVEYGREVLIVSTSGVSTVIRPDGSIADSIGLFTPGFAVPEVPLIGATTPGTVLTAPLRWALTALCPVFLAGAAFRSRSCRRATRHRLLEGHRP